jgi:hypothetical protein
MAVGLPNTPRRLCACLDIAAWTSRPRVPDREALQSRLYGAMKHATQAARVDFDELYVQIGGDGAFIVFPGEIDEPRVIDTFIRTLATDLRRYNAGLPTPADRLRVRLSMGQGILRGAEFGYATDVAIEVPRLVDADITRAALNMYPGAELAVIVTADLYQDVIMHEFFRLPAAEFWPVHVRAKNLSTEAWLYVSDRTGGPAIPPAGDVGPTTADRVCLAADLVGGEYLPDGDEHEAAKRRLATMLAIFAWETNVPTGSWQHRERPDGFDVVMPPDLDEPEVFRVLLEVFSQRMPATAELAGPPLRVRLALTRGQVPVGAEAVHAAPVRLAAGLAASAEVRGTAMRHPKAPLVVAFHEELRDSVLGPGQRLLAATGCLHYRVPVGVDEVATWVGVVGQDDL